MAMAGTENTPSAMLETQINKRPKLLVVDDQPINIQVLYQAFSADYQVFMATSGAQALTICREKLPDLVLLDVIMPGLDGYEVCAQLKAEETTRNIPVIFVTAHNDPAEEERGLDVGAVDFISKPINPKVVRARVKTHITLKFQSDLLRQMAFIDGLTGVYNRRHFNEMVEIECQRATRNNRPLSLMMIDVDFFKRFNDSYGHQAGDDCLRQVASTLKNSLLRPADSVSRYGGEEFVCLLPETDFAGAMQIAAHLERCVRAVQIAHATSDADKVVTISLGVAGKGPTDIVDSARLIALADAQLYQAKASGRACACGESAAPGAERPA